MTMLPFHYSIHLLMQQKIIPQHVIDVGVSNHLYILFWASLAKSVTGFEPEESSFREIKGRQIDHPQQFTNVEILPWAVGNSDEDISFWADRTQPAYSVAHQEHMDRLREHPGLPHRNHVWEEQQVKQIRLDSLFDNERQTISLIKADTEFHDLDVLLGAQNTIKRHRPVLQVEHILETPDRIVACDELMKELDYRQVIPHFETDQKYFVPGEWKF